MTLFSQIFLWAVGFALVFWAARRRHRYVLMLGIAICVYAIVGFTLAAIRDY